MRVLVTGGSGFIGSHLIPKLAELGQEVYSLERYVTGRYVLGAKTMTVFGDLRDSFTIRKLVREAQPDAVIHLASISPVAYSYDHPQEVFDVNSLGTINLAEACLREVPHFKHFLFAGTSEEYGNQTEFPIKEDAVKLGDPTPVRDLLYIDDHVDAYLACLGNKKAIGDVFNFCTGHGVSIKELVEQIAKLVGFDGEIIWGTIPARPLDIKKLVGNCEKAKRVFGWKPKYTLAAGLRKNIDFWKRKLNTGDEEVVG